MKKLILLLSLILLIGCNETVVEPFNLGGDNLGIKSIVIKKYNRQNDDYILAGHYLEEYNEKGLLTTRIEYNLMEEGKIYFKHERFYDENDNILNSQTHTNDELEWEAIYTYKRKKIHKVENYHEDELVYTTSYEYKENYRKRISIDLLNDSEQINEEFYNEDGSYILNYETNYFEALHKGSIKFNSENQMLESTRYENDNLMESSTFEYDDKGNKTKIITQNSNGKETVRLFVYDEFNHLIRHENNDGGSDFVLEYIYEYDDKGNYILKTDKMYDEVSHYEERTITYWE